MCYILIHVLFYFLLEKICKSVLRIEPECWSASDFIHTIINMIIKSVSHIGTQSIIAKGMENITEFW